MPGVRYGLCECCLFNSAELKHATALSRYIHVAFVDRCAVTCSDSCYKIGAGSALRWLTRLDLKQRVVDLAKSLDLIASDEELFHNLKRGPATSTQLHSRAHAADAADAGLRRDVALFFSLLRIFQHYQSQNVTDICNDDHVQQVVALLLGLPRYQRDGAYITVS